MSDATEDQYQQVYSGGLEWYDGPFFHACCDCGLIHYVKMGVGQHRGKPRIWFRFYGRPHMTKMRRRKFKIKVTTA